jgi:hypothetical protein
MVVGLAVTLRGGGLIHQYGKSEKDDEREFSTAMRKREIERGGGHAQREMERKKTNRERG